MSSFVWMSNDCRPFASRVSAAKAEPYCVPPSTPMLRTSRLPHMTTMLNAATALKYRRRTVCTVGFFARPLAVVEL